MRFAFVSTYPPRRCGIATFTAELISAVQEADSAIRSDIAAIDERHVVRAYPPDVRWRISQGTSAGYAGAANAIAASEIDAVCVQHEFGLYGIWHDEGWDDGRWIEGTYEDHLTAFLEAVRKPTLVTMHTVLPEPSPAVRDAVRRFSAACDGLIVMAESAVEILRDTYGVTTPISVIQHGMPHIEPHGRRKLKEKMDLDGRSIISTFGLVGPGKGLEYMIEAMPAIAKEHPSALYVIAGQTHPELLRRYGEDYRNSLLTVVEDLDLGDHVMFLNEYLTQDDIIEFLLATDIYVTPYLDPNQITSGTLSYALGAGKAVVSTPYLHAKEALADDRGVLVDFRSADGLAAAIGTLLDDPERKAQLEQNAYAYANEFTWPKTGERFLEALEDLVGSVQAVPRARPKPGGSMAVPIAARLKENPLITPEQVAPSQLGMEVISTINAGVARVGDEVIALLRVAERPRMEGDLPQGAKLLELGGSEPRLAPLPSGFRRDELIGVPFLDLSSGSPEVVLSYVPRDLPGLDLADPRSIRYRDPTVGHRSEPEVHVDYLTHVSHLRVARSPDGITFTIDPTPALMGATRLEEYGVEDPRVTPIDDAFMITYVSVSRLGITTSLLRTTDFRTFERKGTILLPDQKDVVLFPERVGDKYLAFTRPMPASFGHVLGIWLAESPDLLHWGAHRPVALPRPGQWDEARIGASLTPIRLDEGWLELYHGADRTNRYGMGALLLDADDPSKVLGRTVDPLLVPEVDYERSGFLQDVVFPSGHISLGNGRIRVYYGAADAFLAAADFAIDDIMAQMKPC